MGFFKTTEEKLQNERDKQAIYEERINHFHKQSDLRKELDNTRKVYSIFKRAKKLDAKALKAKLTDKFLPTKTMLIHMELRNGFHTQFLVVINNSTFKFQKGEYIVDDELKYYDVDAKLWCLDYHQDFPVPIARRIHVNKLKKVIRGAGITDIDTAFNPATLRQFIESEVIQKVMKGQEMDAVFKFLKFTTITTLILSLITVLILVQTTGLLSNLQLPF